MLHFTKCITYQLLKQEFFKSSSQASRMLPPSLPPSCKIQQLFVSRLFVHVSVLFSSSARLGSRPLILHSFGALCLLRFIFIVRVVLVLVRRFFLEVCCPVHCLSSCLASDSCQLSWIVYPLPCSVLFTNVVRVDLSRPMSGPSSVCCGTYIVVRTCT